MSQPDYSICEDCEKVDGEEDLYLLCPWDAALNDDIHCNKCSMNWGCEPVFEQCEYHSRAEEEEEKKEEPEKEENNEEKKLEDVLRDHLGYDEREIKMDQTLLKNPVFRGVVLNRMRNDTWDVRSRERGDFPVEDLRSMLGGDKRATEFLSEYELMLSCVSFLKLSSVLSRVFESNHRGDLIQYVLCVMENLIMYWGFGELEKLGYVIDDNVVPGKVHPTFNLRHDKRKDQDAYVPVIEGQSKFNLLVAASCALSSRQDDVVNRLVSRSPIENDIWKPWLLKEKMDLALCTPSFMERLVDYASKAFGEYLMHDPEDFPLKLCLWQNCAIKRVLKRSHNDKKGFVMQFDQFDEKIATLKTKIAQINKTTDDVEHELQLMPVSVLRSIRESNTRRQR